MNRFKRRLFAFYLSSLFFQSFSDAAEIRFPDHFKWCVATSAHQIEGNNFDSNWWKFENQPGSIRDGKVSGIATDHWNRLEEDTQLLADLNIDQYRFSVEWAKLEPRPGQWNQEAFEHYKKELFLLNSRGIEPMITLQHFTLPQWVADEGGFEWEKMPEAFETFATRVYQELGSAVRDWITINEPQVMLALGYVEGIHPPAKKDLSAIHRPAVGMIRSHARAYHALHKLAAAQGRKIRVGLAHHLRFFQPANSWNPLDRWATQLMDQVGNWSILDALKTGIVRVHIPFVLNYRDEIPEAKNTQDFIGINYYTRGLIKLNLKLPSLIEQIVPRGAPKNDLGWEIYPKGLYEVIRKTHRRFPELPILITENGTADHEDHFRGQFLVDHLFWIKKAIDENIQVETYCHWSFLDNYEWADGFEPRFGLYEVDYSTLHRTLRPSGQLFSEIARSSSVRFRNSD